MGDLDDLVGMGFDKERAELALKHGGNLPQAIDWLGQNENISTEELKESASSAQGDDGPPLAPGEVVQSLVCNDCGKRFRSQGQAEFHASKTEHTNFSESTEEIAPLTEDQKKEKLAELMARRDAKRAEQSDADKAERMRNEEIRKKSTKEQQDAKEDLARKQKLKEAEAKQREKREEVEAKRRIQQKIADDKEARRLKAEAEKAARAGQPPPQYQNQNQAPAVGTSATAAAAASKPKTAAEYTESRLRVSTPNGNYMGSFKVETTLAEVAAAVEGDKGVEVSGLEQNFPKKVYDQADWGMTLKEAGLVPSAALVAK